MKKRVSFFALILTALLAFSGCGAEKPSAPAESAAPESSASAETSAEENTGAVSGAYRPGTYEGKGAGYAGDISVSVTVDAEKIVSITVTEEQEGKIGEKVYGDLTGVMLKSNTAEVDVVSGATVTSKGFKEAVRNALAAAQAE